jgi:tRNA-2-methylthio-N6-dimethylallyladenosine synthase
MRRGYDRATYLEKAALLRDRRPDLVLTSDIIVGYPGETEDDFAATVALVDEVGFEGLFVFTYSPRPGTSALRLTDDVPEDEKLRRLKVLNERQQRAQARLNAGWVGRIESVLVDAADVETGRVSGRSPHFRIVHADGPADLVGSTVDVEILGAGANSLTGRILAARG